MALSNSRPMWIYLVFAVFSLTLVIFYASRNRTLASVRPQPTVAVVPTLIEVLKEPRREKSWWADMLGQDTADKLEKLTHNPPREIVGVKPDIPPPHPILHTEYLLLFEKAALERIRRKPTLPPRTLFELNAIFYDGLCKDQEDEVTPKTHDPEYLRRANAESALNIPSDIQLDGYILLLVDEHIANALETTRMEFKEDTARKNLKWISKHTPDMKNPE